LSQPGSALLCTSNCMPGMFLRNGSCTYCPAGRSSSVFNSTTCNVVCSAGTFSPSDQLWCEQCPLGKYGDSPELGNCLPCSIGTYSDQLGLTSCTLCPSSKVWTSAVGASSINDCLDCADGYFKANSTCLPCPIGKYSNNATCSSCPQGKFSQSGGLSFCQECPDGTYNPLSEVSSVINCTQCPKQGFQCKSGSSYPFVLSGWFRDMNEDVELALKCIPEEACAEGGSSTTLCTVGYQGRACSLCSDGYFRLGEKCRICLPAFARWLVICALVALAVFAFWKLSLVEERIPYSFKIALQWIQFLGVYGLISDKWPSAVKVLFNITGFFNIDLQYFGFTCDKAVTFWSVWLFKGFFPIFVFVSIVGLSYLRMRFHRRMEHERAMADLKPRLSRFCAIGALFATMVFSTLFQIFNCVEQTDGSNVLKVDPSIKCFTSTWNQYVVIDVTLLFLYMVIFPSVGLYIIWKYRNDHPTLELLMKPFLAPYRKGCEYWEFIRIFQKVLFFAIRDVNAIDRTLKAMFLFVILMVGHLVDTHVNPYRTRELNQHSFRWNQLCLLFLTSVFVFESDSPRKEVLAGLLVLGFCMQLISAWDTFKSCKKRKNQQNQVTQATLMELEKPV
jgi:hypothetical protein